MIKDLFVQVDHMMPLHEGQKQVKTAPNQSQTYSILYKIQLALSLSLSLSLSAPHAFLNNYMSQSTHDLQRYMVLKQHGPVWTANLFVNDLPFMLSP